MKPIFAFLLGIMTCGAAPGRLHAQAGSPASSGIYTTQQAARGSALYQSKCSSCHGDDLSGGGTSPALAGPDFLANWTGQPVAALLDRIRKTMPADRPDTLTAQQAVDLVAFLLRANRFPAGKTELPADVDRLQHILIDTPPSAPAN